MLHAIGLQRVGFIWTALKVNEKRVLENDRDPDTPLLPAEMTRMARLQERYPNVWAHSRDGKFGSKFVSVIIRGLNIPKYFVL